jgi:hypothetical protein
MKTHLIAALLVTMAAPASGEARIKPPAMNDSMPKVVAHRNCGYPPKYGAAIPMPDPKLRDQRAGLANPNTIVFGIAY